uniref:ATP synthase F0 subunit 8 n=1 Tax=Cyclosa japonica TaxID=1112403 RepID=A0A5B9REA8_9ARAC|nr:ATP synthase F0 subunit 8 [Cyclosa japonica]QEG58631.1 ATP synthase F0 subunit 8 [Cyclosa japonica]
MPQLMPLSWIFSSVMMVLMLVSAGVVYSEINKKVSDHKFFWGSKNIMWCW